MAHRLAIMMTLALASAQDWPQFLGPGRDGVYRGPETVGWSAAGPKQLWSRKVGQGFSPPVVSQGRLILFHRVKDREVVESLDAKTGRTVWTYDYPTAYRDDFGFDEGPRAAPTVAGNRVYTFGAEGTLHGLDFASGKKLWSVDTHKTFRVSKGFFGAACSPLVEGGKVLLNIGGQNGAGIVAFDAETGDTVWKATDDQAGYSAPVAATIGGARHALFFTRAGLVDLDPANGRVRFQFPWRSRSNASVNAATPVVAGNLVFVSASYGTGAVLLAIEGSKARQVWSSDDAMSNHYATSVLKDGYLYGFHGRQEHGASLRSVELKTGKVAWNVDGLGAGTVTVAGNRLLVLRENGELIAAEATPKGFQPVAKAAILTGTVRAYPALAGGLFYARNEDTLRCVDVRQ